MSRIYLFILIFFLTSHHTSFSKESFCSSYPSNLFQEINSLYEKFITNHININFFSFKKEIPEVYYDCLSGQFCYHANIDGQGKIENQFLMDFSYYKELTDYLYYETNGLINFTKKENEPSFLVPREAFIGGYILDYQLDLRAGILNIPKIENVKNSFYLSDDHFENYYDKASFSGIHLKHFFNENWSTEIYFLIPSLYTFSNVSSLNYNSYSSSNVTLNYENISYQKEKPKNTNYLFNLHYKMNENIFSISYYKGNYDIPLPFDLDYVNQLPVVLLKYPEYRWLELNWQVSLLNEKLKYKNQLAYIDPTDWHFLENQYWEKPFISYSAFIDYEMNSSTSIQLAYSSNHNIIEEWEDSSPLMCLEVKKSFHTIDLYAGLEYHFNAHQLNEGIGFKYQFRKNLSLEGGYFSNDRGFFQISYTF